MLASETPTVPLLSGVTDPAKRHDFAEHLRANAIPAIVIDKAPIAFTATQRETRARTIFECGMMRGLAVSDIMPKRRLWG